jgi:uncharacterized protein with PIN domain
MSVRVRIANPHLHLVPRGPAGSLAGEDLDATQPMLRLRAVTGEDSHLRCLRCDGRVVRSEAPVEVERAGVRVSWEALPAWVCTRCEAAYFEERQVQSVRQALAALRKAVDC